MARIPNIDKYEKDFPSIYGIDTGFCYDVKDDFYVEALIEYEEGGYLNGVKYYEPSWTLIKLLPEDSISASKNGVYALLKDFEGFVEIRPRKDIGEQKPSFDSIKNEYLTKIGKDAIELKIMPLEDRKEIINTRGI